MIDRKPAVIARCSSSEDVVQAVRFAREQKLLVSIKGGATTSRPSRLRRRPPD